MPAPHLVIGANGAFGSAIVRALLRRGEPVRAMVRDRSRTKLGPEVEVVEGDAASLTSLLDVAKGCDTLFHGASVPIARWEPELVALTDTVIEASGLLGATLVLPGTVMSVRPIPGVPLPPMVRDPEPLDHIPPKGRVRQYMDLQAQQNAEMRNIRTILVRSGDWFGPGVDNALTGPMFRAALAGRPVPWHGPLGAPHEFVYVDDVAEATLRFLFAPDRPLFEVAQVSGHLLDDGTAWAKALGAAAGKGDLAAQRSRWVKLQGLWHPGYRDLALTQYLWEAPILLDDSRARSLGWTPTPLGEALARTMEWFRGAPHGI